MNIYHTSFGQGHDLVLLHGWGFNHHIWEAMTPELAKRYRVHLIDLPGFGLSRHAELSDDFALVLQALLPYLPAKATYLGWSLGGLLANGFAYYFPERVHAIMTVGSSPKFLSSANWQGVTEDFFNEFRASVISDPSRALKQFILLMLALRPHQKNYLSEFLSYVNRNAMPDQKNLLNGLSLLANTDLRTQLAMLKCPSRHFVGEFDPLCAVNPEVPFYVIPGAGHAPFITNPDKTLQAIKDFLHEIY